MKRRHPNCPLVLTAHCLLLAVLLVPVTVRAEQGTTATLSGTVTDPNGAAISGARVTATNNDTGLKRTDVTTESGTFSMALLPPSTYTVLIEHQGFTPAEIKSVVLNVGDNVSLSIQLKLGAVGATVDVQSEAPLVNESPAVATIVDRQFVENIPLNGRSFQSLITLTPGVVTVPGGSNTVGQFSVNGSRASANSFMVDGVSANIGAQPGLVGQAQTGGNLPGLTTFGSTQSMVSVDAMQEFQIQTSTYAAEYGRQPGGQISIVTRSGTNQFHGVAFDYLRNDVFDANDWFANRARQPKPAMRQNDFGGTFGGPVLIPKVYDGRNRTFFFFSYEGLRLRLPVFSTSNVPTLALRQGAPAGMQPILNSFPLPNGRDLGNGLAEFSSGYSDPSSLDATSIRIDHTVSSKLLLFGRFNNAPSESKTRRAPDSLSSVQTGKLEATTITIGATSSFTPTLNNEFRINFSRNSAFFRIEPDDFGGAIPVPRNVMIPTQWDVPAAQGNTTLNFVGRTAGFPRVQFAGDKDTTHRQFNILDSVSLSVGEHQLKFGFDFRRLTPTAAQSPYLIDTTFASIAQVQASSPGTTVILATLPTEPVFLNWSLFAQDTWRVSPRLSLTLGLRWDVNPAPTEANGNDQLALTQVTNLATMELAPAGTEMWKTTYDNFAPRIGAAYTVSQATGRELVLRGGFGVFYDSGNDLGAANFGGNPPYASTRVLTSGISYPLVGSLVAPAPLPIDVGLTTPYPNFIAFDPNLKLPYTLQWNASLEQSLGAVQSVTVSYVGAAGRRLLHRESQNIAAINPKFTFVNLISNKSTSDYNALQAQYQRRLSRGLQALVSYTWSHALDSDSTGQTARQSTRGNANFDVRHILASAATYNIPSPSQPVARAIFGHWSLDARFQAQSSLPVDLVAGFITNPADGALIDVRPNLILGVPLYIYDSSFPGGRRINRAAFSAPPAGQSGNLGRNQVRALAAWQLDAALRREFPITEGLRLQFRAEAFNLFNHPNFGAIATNLTAVNFGEATNMLNRQLGGISQLYQIGGPRSMQFALKLLF